MACRTPDNLRSYLQNTRLVPLNLGSSQCNVHAVLHAVPRRYRKLRTIYPLQLSLFNEYCQDWTNDFVPCISLGGDVEMGERFTVPCPPYCHVPPISLVRADNLKRLFTWINLIPLETARRAMHLLHPETKMWSFASDAQDVDRDIFKCVTWSQIIDHNDGRHYRSVLSICIQPPWILSVRDLELFCKRQSFLRFSSPAVFHKRLALPHERLWYKLWDCSVRKSCSWFVVSTYTHWVFGVFSTGWTAAFVSPVYSHDCQAPSVLQLLLFWLSSAMGFPGGWVVPDVCIEPAYPSEHLTATLSDLEPEMIRKHVPFGLKMSRSASFI